MPVQSRDTYAAWMYGTAMTHTWRKAECIPRQSFYDHPPGDATPTTLPSLTCKSRQGTLLIDSSGTDWVVLYANQAASDLTGLSLDTLISQPFQTSFDAAKLSVPTSNVAYFFESAIDFHLTCSSVGEQGVKVWLNAHFWPAR